MQRRAFSWTGVFFMSAASVGFTMVITLILAATPSPALAYVDPNAGGLLFQLLTPIAAIAAVGLSVLRRQCRSALAWVFRRISGSNGRISEGDPRTKEQ